MNVGMMHEAQRLSYFESVLGTAVKRAAALAKGAKNAQQFARSHFEASVAAEIDTIRREIGPERSRERNDNQLRAAASQRVMQKRVDETRELTALAKNAHADARRAIDQVKADARRLSLGPLDEPSRDAPLTASDRLVLRELRTMNRQMALQEARTQVARVQSPQELMARLKAAEQTGDRMTAVAIDELLEERLATVPPADNLRAIAEHRTLRQEFDQVRDARIPEHELKLLTETQDAFESITRDVANASTLQLAIASTGMVTVNEELTPSPV